MVMMMMVMMVMMPVFRAGGCLVACGWSSSELPEKLAGLTGRLRRSSEARVPLALVLDRLAEMLPDRGNVTAARGGFITRPRALVVQLRQHRRELLPGGFGNRFDEVAKPIPDLRLPNPLRIAVKVDERRGTNRAAALLAENYFWRKEYTAPDHIR